MTTNILTLEGVQKRRAEMAAEARRSRKPRGAGKSHVLERIKIERGLLRDIEATIVDQKRDKKLDELVRLNRELQEQLNRKQGTRAQRAQRQPVFGQVVHLRDRNNTGHDDGGDAA